MIVKADASLVSLRGRVGLHGAVRCHRIREIETRPEKSAAALGPIWFFRVHLMRC